MANRLRLSLIPPVTQGEEGSLHKVEYHVSTYVGELRPPLLIATLIPQSHAPRVKRRSRLIVPFMQNTNLSLPKASS